MYFNVEFMPKIENIAPHEFPVNKYRCWSSDLYGQFLQLTVRKYPASPPLTCYTWLLHLHRKDNNICFGWSDWKIALIKGQLKWRKVNFTVDWWSTLFDIQSATPRILAIDFWYLRYMEHELVLNTILCEKLKIIFRHLKRASNLM